MWFMVPGADRLPWRSVWLAGIILALSLASVQAASLWGWKRNKPPLPPPPEETLSRLIPVETGSTNAPLLFCIGLHIEPFGAAVSPLAAREADSLPPKPGKVARNVKGREMQDFNDPQIFIRHTEDIRALADVVGRHNGRMTVQAQTPYSRLCVEQNVTVLTDLLKSGHEVALHFHEDAHLGPRCERLPPGIWTAVMKEEIDWIKRACPAADVRYWSGGNNYPQVLEAASGAGLQVMSDHKNPKSQQTFEALVAVNPWRPSGGPAMRNVDDFARHDAQGKIVYLPDGVFLSANFSKRKQDGDAAWFDSMTEGLELSLKAAKTNRVNVFHITVHSGEFHGPPGGKPFNLLDQWLTQIVEPLVKAGKIRWAAFSEMADAYRNWEAANPGVPPRGKPNQRDEE